MDPASDGDRRGARCGETKGLEFDPIHPLGMGGDHAVTHVRLLRRAHNAHTARRAYGRERIERAMGRNRSLRANGRSP